MSIGGMQWLITVARRAAFRPGREEPGSGVGHGPESRRILHLLLPVLALILFADLAGLTIAGNALNGAEARFEPAELRSGDLPLEAGRDPLESRPALKRGGFVVAAVESSRRKMRVPQRPPAQPLILTSRFIANGKVWSHDHPWPRFEPPLNRSVPGRPFLARGPPSWTSA